MASTTSVTYAKINPAKLSFFDLSREIRKMIYKEYFAAVSDYTLHLVKDRSEYNDTTRTRSPPLESDDDGSLGDSLDSRH